MSFFSGHPWKIDPHKYLAPKFSHFLDSWWKEMATHSSILAWGIPWTKEPGGLLSMGSHRVGHNWSDLACMHALETEMATYSSILAWRIPGTEEPGGLLSMGSHKVGHDWSNLAAAACLSIIFSKIVSSSSLYSRELEVIENLKRKQQINLKNNFNDDQGKKIN